MELRFCLHIVELSVSFGQSIHGSCSSSPPWLPAVLFEVFFTQPSVPASFSPCVESMGSPSRLLRSTAHCCAWAESGPNRPFTSICFISHHHCNWMSRSHMSSSCLEIPLSTAHSGGSYNICALTEPFLCLLFVSAKLCFKKNL